MPLTAKGEEIKRAMEKQYGAKKGEQVFYASANKGTIEGVHDDDPGEQMNPQNLPGGGGADLNGPAGILSIKTDHSALASNPPIAGENESAQDNEKEEGADASTGAVLDKNVSEMTPAELAESKKGISKNDLANLAKNENAKPKEPAQMGDAQDAAYGFDMPPGKEFKAIQVAPKGMSIADIQAANRKLWYQQSPENPDNERVNNNESD